MGSRQTPDNLFWFWCCLFRRVERWCGRKTEYGVRRESREIHKRDDRVGCLVLHCREKTHHRVARVLSVLQCVAVCCSVLQCVAVCCSVLQCVAVCFSREKMPHVSRLLADTASSLQPRVERDEAAEMMRLWMLWCVSMMWFLLRGEREKRERLCVVCRRGGGLGSSTIFKKFNEPYAPS